MQGGNNVEISYTRTTTHDGQSVTRTASCVVPIGLGDLHDQITDWVTLLQFQVDNPIGPHKQNTETQV